MSAYSNPRNAFSQNARIHKLSPAASLNSNNSTPRPPHAADVVAVGAGIHALIYAIHAKKCNSTTHISVLEKSLRPGYKIGESTLTIFGLWLKTVGIGPAVLLRLFGLKDGLAFYYFSREGEEEAYTEFCANGPPGDFVPTCQMERAVSELLLTLFAQRLGVDVYHGCKVDISGTTLSREGNVVDFKNVETEEEGQINARLVVDATGRFRQLASKDARLKRFEGWNTDAFWAYFRCDSDESKIPLRHYETCNTNHICLPEGWAWVIRLPSWEGSPLPNLMDMISYLLDLNERNTPGDQFPSSHELAQMFDLKFQWVVSIGFALRTDVDYPRDLMQYGTREAEQKFNWIVSRYPKVQAMIRQHSLIEDLYGPGTTWFVRKRLTYQSPRVSGAGWISIGDATGFTNPLFSPGINNGIASSVFAAELTRAALDASDSAVVFAPYDAYCAKQVPALHRMNVFNYACMRSPKLGPLGPLWQYLAGTGNVRWQRMRCCTFEGVAETIKGWNWGSQEVAYVTFAEQAIKLLAGPPVEPDESAIDEVLRLSKKGVHDAVRSGVYFNRWAGLLRWYDDELEFREDKVWKDVLSRRCGHCRNWILLREDWRKCTVCGGERSVEDSRMVLVDKTGAPLS